MALVDVRLVEEISSEVASAKLTGVDNRIKGSQEWATNASTCVIEGRKELEHSISSRDVRGISFGSMAELHQQMFCLLERTISFPICGQFLKVGVAKGVRHRGMYAKLM